jgi:parvulin-like peptidyl-prolyl isomerase
VYVKRSIGAWLNSPTAQSVLETLDQIKQNQHRIQGLSADVDRLDKTTADLLEQLGEIQEEIKSSGEISRNEYRQIMQEISNIRTLLDRRGNLS